MDKYRIDSHKLIYHVGRVNDWLAGKDIYPIYAEVSPSGTCNHRCTFCGTDFMEYKRRFLDVGIFKERLTEMGALGLKSIMYAGEGEPLLHKQIDGIIAHTKASGIDSALTTNGVLLKEDLAEKLLPDVSWIKVSIAAGTEETYSKLHRANSRDFQKVMANMAAAAKIRDDRGYSCALGMQLLLLPENRDEVALLARQARDIGLDYLVVKPYSQHPKSKTRIYKDVTYAEDMKLKGTLDELSTKDFSVIFRVETMKKWDNASRDYKRCQALRFWTYIDAGGHVWGCSMFMNDEAFYYGDINTSTFREIWEGEKRMALLKHVEKKMDATKCRVNCRMDAINRYLWELKHPAEHVNFI